MALLPLAAAVSSMPRVVVDGTQRTRVSHGKSLEAPGMEGAIAVLDSAGQLVGVYVAVDGTARPEVVIS
jgi:hypothetical protein